MSGPTFEERYRHMRENAEAFIANAKVRAKIERERKRYSAALAIDESIRSWQAAIDDDDSGRLWPVCEVCGEPIKDDAEHLWSDDGCDFHSACLDGRTKWKATA